MLSSQSCIKLSKTSTARLSLQISKVSEFFKNFYNTYLFTSGATQSATATEIDQEVRHQVRLFEIDAICLQSQVE